MKPHVLAAALMLTSGALAGGAPAQAALYDDLGGPAGIDHIVETATARFLADPRIAKTFEDTNMDRFKTRLTAQLCQVSGGPCVYHGRDMTAAHRGLKIDQEQFNALVEDLQDAMTTAGVGYHTQNRLLGLLAPMQRDVVTQMSLLPRTLTCLMAAGLATAGAGAVLGAAAVVTVVQKHRAFSVAALTLHIGDTVHFTNEDEFTHQAFIKSPGFNFEGPEEAPGDTVDVTFTKRGVFDVQCEMHPRMHLSVTVE